jgi:hypothetical protein
MTATFWAVFAFSAFSRTDARRLVPQNPNNAYRHPRAAMTACLTSRYLLPLGSFMLAFWASALSLAEPLDKYQHLKRLSLDLRDKLPLYEEYIALDALAKVPDSTVDAYLASDDFAAVAERFHADLLWPSLTLTKLTTPAYHLVERGGKGLAYDIGGASGAKRRRSWRGDADIQCLDELQTAFETRTDPTPLRIPIPKKTWLDNGKEIRQEGYVLVRPYWDPTREVKVCAYAAQEAMQTPVYDSAGNLKRETDKNSPNYGQPVLASCIDGDGVINPLCGCGPNLRTCFGPGVEAEVQAQLAAQLLRLIKDHTLGDQPYSEMLTTERVWTNGAIQYWSKYLALSTSLNREFNRPSLGDAAIPDTVSFTDKTWRLAERNRDDKGQPVNTGHSGILTLPGYSLRFQTNRSRANHFRSVFTRQYFVPPESPVDPGPCSDTAQDLTERCVCRGCHQLLEPLAAYWGVVSEGGSALISDRSVFPLFRAECAPEEAGLGFDGANYDMLALRSEFCPRFWVSDPGQQNPGVLRPFQFAYVPEGETPSAVLDDLHLTIHTHLQTGPKPLADKIIANGQFHRAMVLHLFRFLMGREMDIDPNSATSELALLNTLSAEFQQHDHFKTLVKRIVMLPQYALYPGATQPGGQQ